MNREIQSLVNRGGLSLEEAQLFLRGGYAGQRNMVLYWATKEKMDLSAVSRR